LLYIFTQDTLYKKKERIYIVVNRLFDLIIIIINFSTCAIYGNPDMVPISESHKKDSNCGGGEQAPRVEKTTYWCAQTPGLKFVNLHPQRVLGADDNGE